MTAPDPTFAPRLSRHGGQQTQYRASGASATISHVLLHGIGSGSASWSQQLAAVADSARLRLLAWDAPGYASSSALAGAEPSAADYAQRLWAWLDALGCAAPVVLVGHSLGALMAASAAALQPQRIARLVLLSPARGYAAAPAAERQRRLDERLDNLRRLGPAGMAQARAAAMLAPGADPSLVAQVRQTMAQIDPAGYTQASQMLAHGDIAADLARFKAASNAPIAVACGSADTITPPKGCAAVAAQAGVALVDLGPVGHICALEAAEAVNRLLELD